MSGKVQAIFKDIVATVITILRSGDTQLLHSVQGSFGPRAFLGPGEK